MNAPARIRPTTGSARRDAYIPIVQTHLPGCDGDELRLRCAMLLMRDGATAVLRHATLEAGTVMDHVERLALLYALAPMPLEVLERLHAAMLRLSSVSTELHQIFPPIKPEEGARARG